MPWSRAAACTAAAGPAAVATAAATAESDTQRPPVSAALSSARLFERSRGRGVVARGALVEEDRRPWLGPGKRLARLRGGAPRAAQTRARTRAVCRWARRSQGARQRWRGYAGDPQRSEGTGWSHMVTPWLAAPGQLRGTLQRGAGHYGRATMGTPLARCDIRGNITVLRSTL